MTNTNRTGAANSGAYCARGAKCLSVRRAPSLSGRTLTVRFTSIGSPARHSQSASFTFRQQGGKAATFLCFSHGGKAASPTPSVGNSLTGCTNTRRKIRKSFQVHFWPFQCCCSSYLKRSPYLCGAIGVIVGSVHTPLTPNELPR